MTASGLSVTFLSQMSFFFGFGAVLKFPLCNIKAIEKPFSCVRAEPLRVEIV